jgi:hypothetical protein
MLYMRHRKCQVRGSVTAGTEFGVNLQPKSLEIDNKRLIVVGNWTVNNKEDIK